MVIPISDSKFILFLYPKDSEIRHQPPITSTELFCFPYRAVKSSWFLQKCSQ